MILFILMKYICIPNNRSWSGVGDEDRHTEADADGEGREHQEAPGDAPEQGRG